MRKIIYLTIILSGMLSSCSDWFDVAPKETYMDEKKLFKQESAFRNAMNGIYTDLRADDAYGLALSLGELEMMGQTFVPNPTYKPAADFNYTDAGVKQMQKDAWSRIYNAIHSCNNLLRIFGERTEVTFVPGSRQMMMAELKALRAFLHFELVRLYHPTLARDAEFKGVSWIESANKTEMPGTGALLTKIGNELDQALIELKKYDPVVTGGSYDENELLGTSVLARRLKMNYYAALAVKMRLCMSVGTSAAYGEAVEIADEIIASGLVSFATSTGTDMAFSGEFIFGLASGQMSWHAMSLYSSSGSGMAASEVVSASAWQAGAPNDLRLKWFDVSWRSVYPKYGEESIAKELGSEQPVPMIKLGEIYLMAAEASLALSDKPGAYAYLNTFANKRFRTTSITGSSTDAEFAAEIMREYQREFLAEGKLFHYYKRKNLSSVPAYDGGTVTMNASKYDWPIPQY